ncbi:helix-turn-helix domain-containing protein [Gallibacterium anatis]|uniref:helix-turn-helix domain-containing protein n=1 Tax=Gallibacterium anatis TaxID=750 RepID=UPI001B329A57|nr:helix-turn-helix domain-containing protein [Gallibacterium anatis]MBP4133555.1 helix-turn-helix domain-containing protein [Gallibacterium anatis]
MKTFTDILNRLKTELSVTMDKDIAEFLGMTKSAFAERKRRDVFPEEALRLADLKHPDLKLNIEYILTGDEDIHQKIQKLDRYSTPIKEDEIDPDEIIHHISGVSITPPNANTYVLLNTEETLLLMWFRRSDSKSKKMILDVSKMSCDLSMATMRLNEYTEKERLKYTEETNKKKKK